MFNNDKLSKLVIRQFNNSDSLEELTSLLHKSYKKLADQGFRFHASHQDIHTTKQRIENAECYVMTIENKLIGTISYRSPAAKDEHPYYDQPFVASFGQFAVDPEYQEMGLGSKLIDTAEKCAVRDGAEEIAIDTAEGATNLIEYYNKRGYRFVTYTQWEVTNYRSVILAKRLKTHQ
ncbi:MAG: N-acetyltransferase [Bacteroidetes bacterium]|nr:N-acetyltransferase [Bacteroidota bacterium]